MIWEKLYAKGIVDRSQKSQHFSFGCDWHVVWKDCGDRVLRFIPGDCQLLYPRGLCILFHQQSLQQLDIPIEVWCFALHRKQVVLLRRSDARCLTPVQLKHSFLSDKIFFRDEMPTTCSQSTDLCRVNSQNTHGFGFHNSCLACKNLPDFPLIWGSSHTIFASTISLNPHSYQSSSDRTKAQGKLGNIVAETFVILNVSSNVSMFAHPWKHCCGNKICFPGSKMFPTKFRNI